MKLKLFDQCFPNGHRFVPRLWSPRLSFEDRSEHEMSWLCVLKRPLVGQDGNNDVRYATAAKRHMRCQISCATAAMSAIKSITAGHRGNRIHTWLCSARAVTREDRIAWHYSIQLQINKLKNILPLQKTYRFERPTRQSNTDHISRFKFHNFPFRYNSRVRHNWIKL